MVRYRKLVDTESQKSEAARRVSSPVNEMLTRQVTIKVEYYFQVRNTQYGL